ncbi:MAG: hypothetical protein K0R73_1433 [Candidatus Midichloriaceae bacterium]|jgi:hypothetical protein|nr:hypothetical protein [Candidatus Midichloriaceae bacterium]
MISDLYKILRKKVKASYAMLRMSLAISFLTSAMFAQAADISVRPIRTDYGIKVYLDNLKSDFNITYENALLTLDFGEDMQYENLGALTKSEDFIKSVVPEHRLLNVLFKDSSITIEKFTENNDRGFNIYKSKSPSNSKPEVTSNNVQVSFEKSNEVVKVKFSWDTLTAATVYARDGKVWAIWNAKAKINIPNNKDAIKLSQLDITPDATFCIIDDEETLNKFPNLFVRKDGYNWIVELRAKSEKSNDIPVTVKPNAAPEPRVDIEFNSAANDPIMFVDSYVGDTIMAFPTKDGSFATNLEHNFTDFKINKTAQGAMIQLYSDSIKTEHKGNIVQIYPNNTLTITTKVFAKALKKDEAYEVLSYNPTDKSSIIDIAKYEINGRGFIQKQFELWDELRTAKKDEKRHILYMEIARFYLANGFYKEAALSLKLLKQENQHLVEHYKIRLLDIVISFMRGEYQHAYKLVNSIDMTDVPIAQRKEIRFWQSIISYITGNDQLPSSKFLDPSLFYENLAANFLGTYTDALRLNIGFIITENKIQKKDLTSAKNLLDYLSNIATLPHDKNRLSLIKANYYIENSQQKKAYDEWDSCIGAMDDLMNRAQCMFNRANYLFSDNLIDKASYAEELETIATIWRGDNLEVTTLSALGTLYYEMNDYINAMRSWKKILDYYPFSPESLGLSSKVGKLFIDFFTNGLDEKVSHMQAVSIFYEFENLIPIGDVGDNIVIRFSEHLIKLDLLDKAASLLKHQVLHRLKGYKREMVINKLANIYILNKRPELAIDIIEAGDLIEELPDDIANQRKYILATAYYENDEDSKALETLGDDLSNEADEIKANIYWREKDWKEFNKFVEPRIYSIRDKKDELSSADAIKVLKLTISYLILDEKKLAIHLLKDFRDRMPKKNINTDFMKILGDTYTIIDDNSIPALKALATIEAQVKKLIEFLKSNQQYEN